MREPGLARAISVMVIAASPLASQAITFETENVSGDFTSTITTGTGIRTSGPRSSLVLPGNSAGIPGFTSTVSGIGDQGDLKYGKYDRFTTYVKGSHELLLKFPEQITFMGRINWLRDFSATSTTGIVSGLSAMGVGADGLTQDARNQARYKTRMMDLWVSKSFELGGQQARVRVGNQVINWGESLFFPGGINQTNAIDVNRLLQPGTQVKEVLLPAPMISFATGLGHGVNVEAYYQARWAANYLPPVGSYWSSITAMGAGSSAYGFDEVKPKTGGQWGVSMRWQPTSVPVNLGAYVMSYTDKSAYVSVTGTPRTNWIYPENRMLYGVSANMPLGDWAIGTEASFRPKDAIALNPNISGCASWEGRCWVDEKRYQWNTTALLSLTPSNARGFLNLIGADGGTFLSEFAITRYPSMKKSYGGDPVAPGFWGWGNETSSDPSLAAGAGTRTSSGVALDFSVTYDGSLIPGWQVVPEIFYSRALSGRTPNAGATFMKGAQSVNLMLTFMQNPLKWQVGLNYAKFWGGSSIFDQPLRDRDFIGAYASYNF